MVGVPARRQAVAHAMRRGLSQRRSCTLLGVARSAQGYRSVKTEKDAPVLTRMAALGPQYPRFGYRRIRIFLEREGHGMSWGRAWRLWRWFGGDLHQRRPVQGARRVRRSTGLPDRERARRNALRRHERDGGGDVQPPPALSFTSKGGSS